MRPRGRQLWVAAILAVLLAVAPSAAAAPCHCPSEVREARADEVPGSCHATESTPESSRDAASRHPESSDGGPCQGSCGACATVAGLTEGGPDPTPALAADRIADLVPAMRSGESRPPDHVPLPL